MVVCRARMRKGGPMIRRTCGGACAASGQAPGSASRQRRDPLSVPAAAGPTPTETCSPARWSPARLPFDNSAHQRLLSHDLPALI